MPIAESNQFTFGPAISQIENGFAHNGIYRGKNLGTITSANIDEFCTVHEIAEGKFTDLYLGDYFVIQDGTYNVEWMIAGFDLDYGKKKNTESISIIPHCICVIPKGCGLFRARMHSSDTTDTGPYHSELGTYISETLTPHFQSVLGSHGVLGNFAYMAASAQDGKAKTLATGNMMISLMHHSEVFGYWVEGHDTAIASNGNKQLPIYNFVSVSYGLEGADTDAASMYWFCDIWNTTQYMSTRFWGGAPFRSNATTECWVRPKLTIG